MHNKIVLFLPNSKFHVKIMHFLSPTFYMLIFVSVVSVGRLYLHEGPLSIIFYPKHHRSMLISIFHVVFKDPPIKMSSGVGVDRVSSRRVRWCHIENFHWHLCHGTCRYTLLCWAVQKSALCYFCRVWGLSVRVQRVRSLDGQSNFMQNCIKSGAFDCH